MLRPTREQLRLLRPFERVAFAIADRVNRRPALKRIAHAFLRTVGAGWVHLCTRNLLHVYGIDTVSSIAPDRGVVVVANHRSFFDMYVIACVLLRHARWIRRMYFPVRSDFFYERPDGILVNTVMSAMAMYPPFVREGSRRRFNHYTVDFIAEALREPGTLVGFHPEGTRNRTPDPYTPVAANSGIGLIIHRAKPIVIPCFILGLSNNLPVQVKGNFDGSGEPVTLVFGAPLELDRFYAEPGRASTYHAIADHLVEAIFALGRQEREIRQVHGLPSKVPAETASGGGRRAGVGPPDHLRQGYGGPPKSRAEAQGGPHVRTGGPRDG